jgi:PKD repeat protein
MIFRYLCSTFFYKCNHVNKSIYTLLLVFIVFPVFSQNLSFTDEEMRNYPHWIELMQRERPNINEVQRAYDLYFENREKVRGSGFKQYERWAWRHRGDFDESGDMIPADQIFNSHMRYQNEIRLRGPATNAGNWKELGPISYPANNTGQENGMGRVNAIAFHPTDVNTFYVGAPSGGLWKTTDGGSSYTSNTDQLPTLGVSSIIVHPADPDIVFIGTGDRDAADAPGLGVFKSFDGGSTWAQYNTGMGNRTVGHMIMHPDKHHIIIAATSNGIYKTVNGGINWTLVSSNNKNYKDIIFHPVDHDLVYATAQGEFYRSVNAGESWAQVTNGLINCSRMVLSTSADEPDAVFCLLTGGSQLFQGIFKSTDKGLIFTRITPASHPNILGYDDGDNNSQAWYDLCMIVNPDDADQILVGSICIHRSDDGGTSFTKKAHWVNDVHADQHVVARNPLNGRLYIGHDGGLHYSDDWFESWTEISDGLRIAQTYRIGQAAQSRDHVINGYQDNGSAIYNGSGFITVLGGDGMESAYDYTDLNYVYSTYISEIKRSHLAGLGGWTVIATNGLNGVDESGAWVTPYMLHVNDPNTMFFGYKNIWRSNNVKSNTPEPAWTKISNNLAGTNSVNFLYIDQSIPDPNTIYAARSDNKLFRSDNVNDASPVWIDLSPLRPAGNGNIDNVKCHPTDPETVYLIQSERVFKSGDKGQSWTEITGSIPSGTNLTCMVIDKYADESLYVGTKTGVFHKNPDLMDWIPFDGSLPVVDVRELEIYYGNTESRLRAATYGRGLWESDLYFDPSLEPVANFRADKTVTFVDDLVSLEDISANKPDTWLWSISPSSFTYENGTGQNSQHPQVKFTSTGIYSVSLTASNSNGSRSKTRESYIHVSNSVSPNCTPSTQNLGDYGIGIYMVKLNTINKSTGQPFQDNPDFPFGYVDFITTDNTVLMPGTAYALTVGLFTGYNQWWRLYIDNNNDGDFNDPGELVYNSPSKVKGLQTITFTTSSNPTMDHLLRMRVICDWYEIAGPCHNPGYGQAEDYGIIFMDLPQLTTTAASNIQINSADSGGDISDPGGSAIIKRGIVFDIREDPVIDKNWGITEDGSGIGVFTSSLTGLWPNTTYYVRAYAINAQGVAYGDQMSFTTLDQEPMVTTADASDLASMSVVAGGEVVSDNGKTVTERGVVWDTTSAPTVSVNAGKMQMGSGIGVFSGSIYGLTPNTTYYHRTYARNSYSVAYGDEKQFTTLDPDPDQSSNISFSAVTTDQLTLEWQNGTGGSRIVVINDFWDFSMPQDGTDPTSNTVYGGGEQVIYNGPGSDAVTVTALDPSTNYYFRVFDYNGHGSNTVYNTNEGDGNPRYVRTHCVPDYTNGDVGTHIKRFVFNTIDKSSGASHYSDFTDQVTSLYPGHSYNVSIEMSYNPLKGNMWIDFNDNGEFEADEKIFSDINLPANTVTVISVPIPPDAALGKHTLRVRASWSTGYDACETGNWGEAEDYSVFVTDIITWTGAISGDWFDPRNWDVGKVPGEGNIVVINIAANNPLIPQNTTAFVKKITTNSGAEIEIEGTLEVDKQ